MATICFIMFRRDGKICGNVGACYVTLMYGDLANPIAVIKLTTAMVTNGVKGGCGEHINSH